MLRVYVSHNRRHQGPQPDGGEQHLGQEWSLGRESEGRAGCGRMPATGWPSGV